VNIIVPEDRLYASRTEGNRKMTKPALRIVLGLALALSLTAAANAGSAYQVGDVFVAVTGVGIEEFTPTGSLVQTINGGALSGFTTGMAFQNNGNLLVTDFSSGTVVQYNNSGTLLNGSFVTGIGAPESIAIDAAGHIYVSSVGGTGITEYNSTGGTAIGTSIAGTRTDWIDLAADQKTMLYTDEGGTTHSVNVATNTSNPDFSTKGGEFALRIIPSGTFAGDVLVASSSGSVLLSADGSTILKSYSGGGVTGEDFALNIDPNGTAFWTADTNGNVAEFDIATGTLLNSWNVGSAGNGSVFGLVVFGQQTASGGGGGGTGGGSATPEPGSLALLGFGLGGLLALKKLR
jgi:PEP-CTERM motif